MGIMTVYHGGYKAVETPEIRIGRNTTDFGNGFYCTVIKEQAQRWAKRYNTKIVSIYDVRLDSSLDIKEFKDMSEEWLDFIIDAQRSGKAAATQPRNSARMHAYWKAPKSLAMTTLMPVTWCGHVLQSPLLVLPLPQLTAR